MNIKCNLLHYLKVTFNCSRENESNVPKYILSRVLEERVRFIGQNDSRVMMVGKTNGRKYND